MADNADLAAEIQQNRIDGHLARHQLPPRTFVDPYCDDCGDEIPTKRREAAPWATTCVDCQSIREEKSRHVR